jgi:hypothetical protein
MKEIIISGVPAEIMRRLLAAELSDEDVRLEIRRSPSTVRGPIDSSMLVAIVGLTSGAMSALITGLLRVLEKRQDMAAKIVIRAADGTCVEVPANTKTEQLESFIALATRLNQPTIQILTEDPVHRRR